jgi:hypothetical protein
MQMNAAYIGITDLLQTQFALLQGGSFGAFSCPALGQKFALFPADAEGVFVPVIGYGGTNAPNATVNHLLGTSTFTTDPTGQYTVVWDGLACDPFQVNATVQNPAYAIFNDVFNLNNGNYSFGYSTGQSVGPNQGIANLYFTSQFNIFILSNPTISGFIQI